MTTLKLADGLELPLDVVTEKLAWLGRTGSGKTYGAMKLAELMLDAGAQIGALDPVGVWRALRVPAQKGGQAFEVVVFGGLYGDLPLQPTAGALIADVVCDRGISFVLDVSQFVAAEQQRFAKAFAERFFQRRKAAPAACHLFMEECQEFLPQNPMGLEADTLHEFQRLWKIGRNFGIGGSLVSQRPQEVNKKALNMSGTLFAFQMTAPQERKAVAPRAVAPTDGAGTHLPTGERATLIAAAQYADGITREQASILTGYKRSSRDAYVQRLLAKAFVEIRGGNVVATDAGVSALGSDYEPLPTGEALREYWLTRLPQGEAAVLEIAISAYPGDVERAAVDEKTGYKRSSRDAYIQRLQARQLLAKGGGAVQASETLFGS